MNEIFLTHVQIQTGIQEFVLIGNTTPNALESCANLLKIALEINQPVTIKEFQDYEFHANEFRGNLVCGVWRIGTEIGDIKIVGFLVAKNKLEGELGWQLIHQLSINPATSASVVPPIPFIAENISIHYPLDEASDWLKDFEINIASAWLNP